MRHVPFILFVIAIVGSIYACVHEENARNQGLPLVHASAPARGFVCVPPMSHWRFKQRNIA